jgi:hypothetical protein
VHNGIPGWVERVWFPHKVAADGQKDYAVMLLSRGETHLSRNSAQVGPTFRYELVFGRDNEVGSWNWNQSNLTAQRIALC